MASLTDPGIGEVSMSVSAILPSSRILFWRSRFLNATTAGPPSPAWAFRVPFISKRAVAPIARKTAWGSFADIHGDGKGELLIGDYPSDRTYYCGWKGTIQCAWVLFHAQLGSKFGMSVSATDFDGDGRSEVVVGAPNWGADERGAAFIVSVAELEEPIVSRIDGAGPPKSHFGNVVAGVGDVNGDGFGDIVVAEPDVIVDPINNFKGKVYLFTGGLNGTASQPTSILKSETSDNFGLSLAGAGDVNADGFADIVVGTYSSGPTYVFLGGPDGLVQSRRNVLLNLGGQFGRSVAGAGDVNGDGYSDLIVGALNASPSGKAFVYFGGPPGVNTTVPKVELAGISGGTVVNQFGHTVTGTGDVDGDGYDDVLVGTNIDPATAGARTVYLFRGSAAGTKSTGEQLCNSTVGTFGHVYGVGDITGDGLADACVTASDEPAGSSSTGQVYPLLGSIAPGCGPAIATPDGAQKFGWTVGSTY